MYVPGHFAGADREALFDLIRRHGFGVLVGTVDGAPFASHLPFMLDEARGPNGTLLAHMARANPHWRAFGAGGEALVIFQGPHAYVSPAWYDPGVNAVPTWNYAVVHAYGTPTIIDDAQTVRARQQTLVAVYENDRETPWRMDSQPEAYLEGMLRGIVAFEIPVDRLEGKFKLNQNHPAANRRGVIEGLRATGAAGDRDLADLMAAREPDRD